MQIFAFLMRYINLDVFFLVKSKFCREVKESLLDTLMLNRYVNIIKIINFIFMLSSLKT